MIRAGRDTDREAVYEDNAASFETAAQERRLVPVVLAWASMLVISDLPNILLASRDVPWLPWVKSGFVLLLATGCLLWKPARPLLPFALVFLAFRLATAASSRILDSASWQETFFGTGTTYARYYIGAFLPDILLAVTVLAVLWLVYRDRRRFFLVAGDRKAAIGPIRWLGIGPGRSWGTFGWIFAAIMGIGVLVPTALETDLAHGQLGRAAPLAVSGIVFAAVNAWTEEVYFRAAILATLAGVVGPGQALLLNAVYFGLAHWLYGSPPGFPGFLMTAFLAYIVGKAMLETRGMAWPWFIHFVPDVVIFAAYALAWVR